MNTIFIVLPILTLLMFDLGLTLKPQDFKLIAQRPKPVIVGLVGQIILLPLIAWGIIALLSTFDFRLSTSLNSQLSTLNFDAKRHVRDLEADLRANHLGVRFHDLCFPAARHSACSNRHRESTVLACLWHQNAVSLAVKRQRITPRTADDVS